MMVQRNVNQQGDVASLPGLLVRYDFIRFLVVGGVGFAVDGGLLIAAIALGGGVYASRAVSFPIAVTATWYLNRIWTFRHAQRESPKRQLSRYFLIQAVGGLVNFGAYSAVMSCLQRSAVSAFLSFAVGSALGLSFNFLGARFLVFTTRSNHEAS